MKSNKFFRPSDGWLSLNIQLKPQMEWGIVCMLEKLDNVDKAIHAVFHASMSCLRVNQKMRKEFRMIPEMYQGLGMFNLNIDGLGARIFFLYRHWNMDTPMGQMLKQAFEALQMNVGLEGNIFVRDFSHLGELAEDCWFKKTWELWHIPK